jgi:hypothetical protein
VVYDRLQVFCGPVSLVCGDFLHNEIPGGCINQRFEKGAICSKAVADFDGGYDVGLYSAHQMNLDPIPLIDKSWIRVFGINPLEETASRKAR